MCIRVPFLVALIFLAACSGNAGREALGSLKSETLSPKYHSGFWADEVGKQTLLWKEAQQLCKTQDASPTPNCRVVFAVDTTVRIIAVHQTRTSVNASRHGYWTAPVSSASPRLAACRSRPRALDLKHRGCRPPPGSD